MAEPTFIQADFVLVALGLGNLSAAGASQMGAKTVLFEKGEMGGDCFEYRLFLKVLLAAGKIAHYAAKVIRRWHKWRGVC